MTPVLLGQILGVAFACGLNLYATVAALGILSRLDLVVVPAGLRGLEGGIVIASALVLFLVEAILDRIPHVDSVWDTVHTLIRAPAAALLAVGVLWGRPGSLLIAGALIALLAALAAHATKAGIRMSLHAAGTHDGQRWISTAEDVLAVGFAMAAFAVPIPTLLVVGTLLGVLLVVGLRFWRAFGLGLRALLAWFRALFARPRWQEADELPRDLRSLLDQPPLGGAPPRGARAAVHGVAGTGDYRNGWLVLTGDGPVFLYRTLFGSRRVDLPPARSIEPTSALWANTLRVRSDGGEYTLYLLKGGPAIELAVRNLSHGTS